MKACPASLAPLSNDLHYPACQWMASCKDLKVHSVSGSKSGKIQPRFEVTPRANLLMIVLTPNPTEVSFVSETCEVYIPASIVYALCNVSLFPLPHPPRLHAFDIWRQLSLLEAVTAVKATQPSSRILFLRACFPAIVVPPMLKVTLNSMCRCGTRQAVMGKAVEVIKQGAGGEDDNDQRMSFQNLIT
ncbi:hypothetical protein BKA70DRAFT_1221758 [Coprinopsis sp. MPI-PUGE-AT-0042]|nr:hypothetical protein BKA70DRAFT_1221758 [Coprinopsis sp. MPI-PUGE-AT-0042]